MLQASREIAEFNVTVPHKVPEGATSVSCKVAFELDLHGLVRCTQATHCHKIEVTEEPPAPAAAPKADAAVPMEGATEEEGGKIEGENGDASNMDTDAPVGPPKPEAAKPAPVKKQKKVWCICGIITSCQAGAPPSIEWLRLSMHSRSYVCIHTEETSNRHSQS